MVAKVFSDIFIPSIIYIGSVGIFFSSTLETIVTIYSNNYNILLALCQVVRITLVIEMKGNFSCGDRIRELRLERGFSQERLALNADITPAYLGLLERGKKNPTVLTIERLCQAMGISLSDFFSAYSDYKSVEDDIGKQILYHLNELTDEERLCFLDLTKTMLQIRKLGMDSVTKENLP